jgi:hypothetical protein
MTLLRRSWFTRLWVVQEVQASSLVYVCSGHHSCRRDSFVDCLDLAKYIHDIEGTMMVLRDRNCADPRDRVFSMMRMISFPTDVNIHDWLRPDYSLSTAGVYRRAMLASLEAGTYWQWFDVVGTESASSRDESANSWVTRRGR